MVAKLNEKGVFGGSSEIPKGMRVATVPVTVTETHSGLILPGDRVDVGPFSLRFDGKGLESRSRSNNVELAARGLRRVVPDRAIGQPLTLLDDVSLVVRPREFVCLLSKFLYNRILVSIDRSCLC